MIFENGIFFIRILTDFWNRNDKHIEKKIVQLEFKLKIQVEKVGEKENFQLNYLK